MSQTLAQLPPDDLLHLAKALEGMAGALHDCRPVPKEDLEVAAQVAHDVWPTRRDAADPHDQQFEAARAELRRFAAAAASGDAKAIGWIERSAEHMALALRWKARQGPPPQMPKLPRGHEPRRLIRNLDKRYARYARHMVATGA